MESACLANSADIFRRNVHAPQPTRKKKENGKKNIEQRQIYKEIDIKRQIQGDRYKENGGRAFKW